MKIVIIFLSVVVLLLTGGLFHFKSELSEQSEQLKTVSSEKYSLETEVIDIRSKKDALNNTVANQKTEIDKLTFSLSDLTMRAEASQSALTGSQETIEKLTKEKAEALLKAQETHAELVSKLSNEIKTSDITVQETQGKLKLSLNSQILFPSGMTTLSDEGLAILQKVGEILQGVNDKVIRVEGHTDNVPIRARAHDRFPTNWELSAHRATHVVRQLIQNSGIPSNRIYAVGMSEFHPVADNATAAGRSQNRRIEILLEPHVVVKEVKELQLVDLKTGERLDPNTIRGSVVAPVNATTVVNPPELASSPEPQLKSLDVESGFANLEAPDSFTDEPTKSGVGYIWVKRPLRDEELNH